MRQHAPSNSIFYHTGRGVFRALLLVALPCWAVAAHFRTLENWWAEASDLPVFEEMQHNFRTGAEVAGVVFRRETTRFYAPDSPAFLPEKIAREPLPVAAEPAPPNRYWHRQEIENQLFVHLPARRRAAARAFLDYIENYRGLALAEMQRARVPASVTLAQGLLESDAGRSFLAERANNHFGIKCRLISQKRHNALKDSDFDGHSLAIDCVQRADDHAWDRFEVYPAADASFRRHSLLLLGERYAWMLAAYPVGEICPLPRPLFGHTEAPYYAAWSLGLKLSGYATAPRYAEKLTLIIETYQLWLIDYEGVMRGMR